MKEVSPSLAPTARALFIGLLGSVAIGVGVPYCNMVLHGPRIASYFNTPAAIILFFFLVFFLNTVLGLLRRSWMLSRAELGVIYIMWIVATAIPEFGLSAFLLPDITSLIYYATPENNWRELLLPFVPDWIIPDQDFDHIKDFYEGAPKGQGIPWALWLPPLIYWIPFVLALYLAMISVIVILRRQWIEHERLIFPLAQVPIFMIQDGKSGSSLIKPFFKSWVMWAGFAVPAIIQTVNGLKRYFPELPGIAIPGASFSLFRDTVQVSLSLQFEMLGLSYFINPDVAFGLCFFYFLNTIQQGIYNILSFQKLDPLLGAYSSYTGSIIVHQGLGAMVVLVLFGLWTARGHLRQVLRKALRGDSSVDDSDEILSYRAAAFLLLGSLIFMGVWLWKSGLPAWIVPVYLLVAFILFIGLTRVVAEGGLAFIFAPMVASDFVAAGLGTRALGSGGILSLAFTYVWASDILTFVMASCANGLKLAEETIKERRRLIFWAILIAIVSTLISSIWAILDLAYAHGGINTDQFFFGAAARYPFENAAARIQSADGPHWQNWGYTAIGAAVMSLLMLARQRLLWWPFHPLGFPISAVFGSMFFSVFVAWLIKTLVVRYGGPKLYMRTRPFFLGLILGQFVASGIWASINHFAGTPVST